MLSAQPLIGWEHHLGFPILSIQYFTSLPDSYLNKSKSFGWYFSALNIAKVTTSGAFSRWAADQANPFPLPAGINPTGGSESSVRFKRPLRSSWNKPSPEIVITALYFEISCVWPYQRSLFSSLAPITCDQIWSRAFPNSAAWPRYSVSIRECPILACDSNILNFL